jgi:ribulose-phosphate 3-epimerase
VLLESLRESAGISTVQLDISDGKFAPQETWRTPQELFTVHTELFLEAHLMVEEPWRVIDEWLESRVARIILHWENFIHDPAHLLTFEHAYGKIKNAGKELYLAFTKDTDVEHARDHIPRVDGVLFFSGRLGFMGGDFNRKILAVVTSFRLKYSSVTIEIDGGVTPKVIREIAEAGVTRAVVGSYITRSTDPVAAITELREASM